MIIGEKREQVIENIRLAAENGKFNDKVEVDDPVLTPEGRVNVLECYLKKRTTPTFQAKSFCARQIANAVTGIINRHTEIIGMENGAEITGGAIITSNHFSPVDNTIIRLLSRRLGKSRLFIVSQETNLMMTGLLGYLMNYADTIPFCLDAHYMQNAFEPMLKSALAGGDHVLIYPEQEMWFNYRKPRPHKSGAHYYAAKFQVPILPCFVEMRDLPEPDGKDFSKLQYTLHILSPIYPDPKKSIRENRLEMCNQDFQQKKEAYESAYHRSLSYQFEPWDIAGWIQNK